jgi:hypothetical protein
MKKFIVPFILFFVLSTGCLYNNQTLIDTRKDLQIYNVDLKITSVTYLTDRNIYLFETIFYEKVYGKDMIGICTTGEANNELISIIESGNYKLSAKVYVDINKNIILLYPVWKYDIFNKILLKIHSMSSDNYNNNSDNGLST